jgi:predicted dehydrogenase
MKTAILGTGIGYEHGERLKGIPGVTLSGIWGRNPDKTAEKAALLGCPAAGDYRELLNDRGTELVLVCLPTVLHEKYVTEALDAGKHVFCETPLAYTAAEAERMVAKAAEKGLSLTAGLFQNFNPNVRWLADRAGEHPLEVLSLYRRTPPVWGRMHHIVLDLMLHDIDTAVLLMGTPLMVNARGVRDAQGDFRCVGIDLAYPSGLVRIEGDSSLPMGYPFTAGFHARSTSASGGQTGEFRLSISEGAFDVTFRVWNESGEVNHGVQGEDPYRAELVYLIECLKSGREPERLSGQKALQAIRIAEQALLRLGG